MIKDWIKLNLLKIFVVLFLISIGLNVFLATWKGINVTKNYITQNHNEQFQGQVSMNMWLSQGNRIIWKLESFSNESGVVSKLNSMPPQYSYFAKVIALNSNSYKVMWPEFMQEK